MGEMKPLSEMLEEENIDPETLKTIAVELAKRCEIYIETERAIGVEESYSEMEFKEALTTARKMLGSTE